MNNMERNFAAAERGIPGLPTRFANIHNLLGNTRSSHNSRNNSRSHNNSHSRNNRNRRASFTPQTVKKHRSKKTRKVRRRKL